MAELRLENGIVLLLDGADKKRLLAEYNIVERIYVKCVKKEGGPRDKSGVKRQIAVHHLVLGRTGMRKGYVVDHINGNSFDCRRKNLRICTSGNNVRNRQPIRGKKYRGVFLVRAPSGRYQWKAKLRHKDDMWVGHFDREYDAIRSWNKKAREVYGKYAYINVWRGPSVRLSKADTRARRPASLKPRGMELRLSRSKKKG